MIESLVLWKGSKVSHNIALQVSFIARYFRKSGVLFQLPLSGAAARSPAAAEIGSDSEANYFPAVP